MNLTEIFQYLLFEQEDEIDTNINNQDDNEDDNNQLQYFSNYSTSYYKRVKEKWKNDDITLTEPVMDYIIRIFNNNCKRCNKCIRLGKAFLDSS